MPVAGTRFPVDDAGEPVRWQASPTLPGTACGSSWASGTASRTSRSMVVPSRPTSGRWTGCRGVVATLRRAGRRASWCTRSRWPSGTPRTGSARAAAAGCVAAGRGPRAALRACGHQQFPRTDPAVIMMVTDGDRALLGRQAAWPAGRTRRSPASSSRARASRRPSSARCRGDRRAGQRRDLLRQPAVAVPAEPDGRLLRAARRPPRSTSTGPRSSDARWFTREEMSAEAEAGHAGAARRHLDQPVAGRGVVRRPAARLLVRRALRRSRRASP